MAFDKNGTIGKNITEELEKLYEEYTVNEIVNQYWPTVQSALEEAGYNRQEDLVAGHTACREFVDCILGLRGPDDDTNWTRPVSTVP